MPEIRASFRSFDDAAAYFRQKVNLPTNSWRDIQQGQHARAFVVAGATRDDMLRDFREAVDAAITQGETLADFRGRFDQIVSRYGWQYNGTRNWRSNVIYQTNLRTAYMAGRWRTLSQFPYLKYQHNTVTNPREEHLAWDGLIIARDDPWWDVHYPPNGWGCRCSTTGVSAVRLRQLRPGGPDAPPSGGAAVPDEWAYHVGHADVGRAVADPVLRQALDARWTALPGKSAADWGRPERLPVDVPSSAPDASAFGVDGLADRWDALYGPSTVLRDPSGSEVLLSRAVVEHWLDAPKRLDGRERYLPILREVIESPAEIWVNWARNERGKIGLRRYYVKTIRDTKDRTLTVIVQVEPGGVWSTFDLFRGARPQPASRQGLLVWGRPVDEGGQ